MLGVNFHNADFVDFSVILFQDKLSIGITKAND